MRALSWRRIGLGIVLALLPALVYLVLAKLIVSGVVAEPTGPLEDVLDNLGLNAMVGLILASLGISTVGQGARLTSPWGWLALFVIALPLLAFVWFLGYATYGGATGSPF